ncbi:MAG: 3'-5' exoribonuclease, partial [Lachnospiraceae bacterium]|nr:3'-5' exoribonuclease [Lachnospiraceae bacterium]
MGLFDFLMGRRSTPTPTKYQNQYGSQNKATATAEKNDLDCDTVRELRGRYIAFDVETTGLSCTTDRIVELGAVVFENGIPTKQFSTLVNPNTRISASASAVNHITNEMLARAPKENTVYPEFVNFMADSLKGGTHLVAHNASFDMNFLKETLMRLGYDAKICYIDTLSLSRKLLSLPDNKQDTVAGAFGIVNEASHRAVTDAKVCGQILWQLLDIYERKEEKSIRKDEDAKKHQAELAEKRKLSDEELEVCACLQKMIYDRGGDTVYLRFYKNSSGYVDVVNIISIIKFKFTVKKGQYIVIPAGLETPSSLPTEKCSVSEGGTANIRLYFANPSNLDFLGDFMIALYKEAMDNQSDFLNNNPYKDKWLAEQYGNGTMTAISIADMDRLIERSRNRAHDAVPEQKEQKPEISKEDVTINPVNTRCPIKDIKNLDNPDKGYAKG